MDLIGMWTDNSKKIKEWSFAGFFFGFLLGLSAHIKVDDGEFIPAVVAIIILIISYV